MTGAVTGFDVSWVSVDVACNTTPGEPRLLAVRLATDRQRFAVVTVTMPWDAAWAPPYTGEEKYPYGNLREINNKGRTELMM